MTLANHGSNRDGDVTGENTPLTPNYSAMTLAELNQQIDSEILDDTLADILSMPHHLRNAAVADFEEVDPALGAKLRLELTFVLS